MIGTRRILALLLNLLIVLGLLAGCARLRRRQPLPTETAAKELPTTATAATAVQETPSVPLRETPVAPIPGAIQPPAFGVLAVIGSGAGYLTAEQAIPIVAAAGIRYMRISLDWTEFEPQRGQLSFDGAGAERIQNVESAGMRLFPTLYVGRGWMNGNPPDNRQGGSRSYPPDDLGTTWSDDFGYSRDYYNFVFQFFSHYRGHFDFVAVENEANSKLFWGGGPDDYVRLLQTAYKAIQAADPNVVVVDSGVVSSLWGLCIADDYFRSGVKSWDEVAQLAITYYAEESRLGTGKIHIRSGDDLERFLDQARVRDQCQSVTYMLDHMGGTVDGINFHFYEDYTALPIVVDYIRWRTGRAGYSPVIVSHEMGQRGPDEAYAEGDDGARAAFKKLVTAAALDMRAVIWFSADTIGTEAPSPDKVGLFGDGGTPRPSAVAFTLVARTLERGYRLQAARAAGPSLYHYVFQDAQGRPTLEALWAEGAGQTVTLAAPPGSTQATVTDFLGRSQTLPVSGGSLVLPVTGDPVFVQW